MAPGSLLSLGRREHVGENAGPRAGAGGSGSVGGSLRSRGGDVGVALRQRLTVGVRVELGERSRVR